MSYRFSCGTRYAQVREIDGEFFVVFDAEGNAMQGFPTEHDAYTFAAAYVSFNDAELEIVEGYSA